MTIIDIKKNTEEKMNKSIETLRINFTKIRTGRAHTGIFDHIEINYYGVLTKISQIGNVMLIDAHTIGIHLWEKKMLAIVEKSIRESNLGFNPVTQGDIIRISIPPLTAERRKLMVKLVKSEIEDAKIAIRNIRRDANEVLKKLIKDRICSEDEERRAEYEIQKLTDKFIIQIDKIFLAKEKELLTI